MRMRVNIFTILWILHININSFPLAHCFIKYLKKPLQKNKHSYFKPYQKNAHCEPKALMNIRSQRSPLKVLAVWKQKNLVWLKNPLPSGDCWPYLSHCYDNRRPILLWHMEIIESSGTNYIRNHDPRIQRKKGCYALAALINALTPKIFMTRFRLYANTWRLISVLTFLNRFVVKCVAPIQALSVPKGCSTVCRLRRIISGFQSRRDCAASSTSSCSQRLIRRCLPVVHFSFMAQLAHAELQ